MLEFSFVLFIFSLLSFSLKRYHVLLLLLSLEFIVLVLYFIMFMYYGVVMKFFMMIYLVVTVCEGAIGLSLLVSLIRSYGNDYFQVFNILW